MRCQRRRNNNNYSKEAIDSVMVPPPQRRRLQYVRRTKEGGHRWEGARYRSILRARYINRKTR